MKVYIFLKHYTSKILFFEINNAVFSFAVEKTIDKAKFEAFIYKIKSVVNLLL